MTLSYERDPARIYAESFRIIGAEAELGRFAPEARDMVIRLIHACGMTDLAEDVSFHPEAIAAGRAALSSGAPIWCDAEMVARGIIDRALPEGVEKRVTLNAPGVAERAKALGTTRSAAAVEDWREGLEGSVVAIGNAPTALFHLLEGLAQGWPKPALILGFPVGFVGAAESKAALAELAPVPFVTVLGRRGGSAMAAAAVNALTLGLKGDGT